MHTALARKCALRVALGGAAALVATLTLPAGTARACSCAPQTQEQAFEQATAVFEGYVTEVAPAQGGQEPTQVKASMKVVRAWKGNEGETATISTAGDSAACGYAFETGRSYLVYAVVHEGGLAVSLCGRTQPIDGAQEDLKLLGMGATTVDPKGATPLPEKQKDETKEPPARGGCAGCSSTGSRGHRTLLGPALLLGLALAATYRRRSASRS